MILADTMIWADHIGRTNPLLFRLLDEERIVMHPYVRGELALGNLPRRALWLAELDKMKRAPLADHREVMSMIESADLFGTGVGYVDSHLIASTMLMTDGQLWTNDKRLLAVSARLGISFPGD